MVTLQTTSAEGVSSSTDKMRVFHSDFRSSSGKRRGVGMLNLHCDKTS